MFCLLWWPFLQYPLLKAGQREWILHVFIALLRHNPEQFFIIYWAFLGNKAVLSDGTKTCPLSKTSTTKSGNSTLHREAQEEQNATTQYLPKWEKS